MKARLTLPVNEMVLNLNFEISQYNKHVFREQIKYSDKLFIGKERQVQNAGPEWVRRPTETINMHEMERTIQRGGKRKKNVYIRNRRIYEERWNRKERISVYVWQLC